MHILIRGREWQRWDIGADQIDLLDFATIPIKKQEQREQNISPIRKLFRERRDHKEEPQDDQMGNRFRRKFKPSFSTRTRGRT